jgi:hypothetical protein
MASKKTPVRKWECDACGKIVQGDSGKCDRPAGWTDATTEFRMGLGDYAKGLDLCAECSEDKEAAIKRWKDRMGQ